MQKAFSLSRCCNKLLRVGKNVFCAERSRFLVFLGYFFDILSEENYTFFERRDRATLVGCVRCKEKFNGNIERSITKDVVTNLSVTVGIRATHYKVWSNGNIIGVKSFFNLSYRIECPGIRR